MLIDAKEKEEIYSFILVMSAIDQSKTLFNIIKVDKNELFALYGLKNGDKTLKIFNQNDPSLFLS